MEGIVFDIKRFAIHDGPGIRTTVFLKGCPLDCWWCHNPESKEAAILTYKTFDKIGDEKIECQREVGRIMTSEQVMDEVLKEMIFMEEGKGGITLSGGEPLMQLGFCNEILSKCKMKGIHTALDTSGFCSEDDFQLVIPNVDLFLFDMKLANESKHIKYTGVSNRLIKANLKHAVTSLKRVIVRIPVIPGINLNHQEMIRIAEMIQPLLSATFCEVHLLPYHHLGKSKSKKFGFTDRMKCVPEPARHDLMPILELFRNQGFMVRIQ